MSLGDLIATQTSRSGGVPCWTCEWVATLDADDLAHYEHGVAAVTSGTLQASALWRACSSYGLHAKLAAFHRHMRQCV